MALNEMAWVLMTEAAKKVMRQRLLVLPMILCVAVAACQSSPNLADVSRERELNPNHSTALENNNRPLIKIAMLHLELRYADLEHNALLLEQGIKQAAAQGAEWIMTPELALTGYRFDLQIGTEWITVGPDQYVQRIQQLADELKVVIFLSHLERAGNQSNSNGNAQSNHAVDTASSSIYNTLFVIDAQGDIIARHHKINTIPVSEDWSTPGAVPALITVDDYSVGLLICADAWPSQHAEYLQAHGAEILVSSASWAPGLYGPEDTWEKRSLETQLPLFVNNRTGIERLFDLCQSSSVVVN
ncbi:MAG: carbon-nitrogen hydrolase family protein, partial [Arenicella sp.]|nr:carbon-nitrogen hydrolase family protein [Arenicella sp.]